MAAEHSWHILRQSGFRALRDQEPATAFEAFYLAVVAFGHDDYERATWYTQRACQLDPNIPLFSAALMYLQRVVRAGKQQVYASPEGFLAFIRGGGNIPLYHSVHTALQQIYLPYQVLLLLDVGVGDGRALIPALTTNIAGITLVEPSAALLAKTQAQLEQRQVPYQAYAEPLQMFVQHAQGHWNVAQATFSFQSIPPGDRPALLRWLSQYTDRLLIVDFDVPLFDHIYAPEHVRSVVERYNIGLAEYNATSELVAQEFLMPVLFGYFDQTAERTNYEQPLALWRSQVQEAGFHYITEKILYHYWWAPAFLLDSYGAIDESKI